MALEQGDTPCPAALPHLPTISLIPSPHMVSDMAPPASPSSITSQDPGSDASDFFGNRDLKQHIWSLPTRADLKQFASRVKRAFQQDIEQLKADTMQLGGRCSL